VVYAAVGDAINDLTVAFIAFVKAGLFASAHAAAQNAWSIKPGCKLAGVSARTRACNNR
jgi:hypothetical protein